MAFRESERVTKSHEPRSRVCWVLAEFGHGLRGHKASWFGPGGFRIGEHAKKLGRRLWPGIFFLFRVGLCCPSLFGRKAWRGEIDGFGFQKSFRPRLVRPAPALPLTNCHLFTSPVTINTILVYTNPPPPAHPVAPSLVSGLVSTW